MYLDEDYPEKQTISWLIEPVMVERPQTENFDVDQKVLGQGLKLGQAYIFFFGLINSPQNHQKKGVDLQTLKQISILAEQMQIAYPEPLCIAETTAEHKSIASMKLVTILQ